MPSEQLIPCPVCDSPAEQAGDAVGCSECLLGWRSYPHDMAEQWNRRPREERLAAERDAALAELRRLRERVELMATHHERQETAYVRVQPRSEHRAIGKAFRELLAEHDAEKAEEG